MKSQQARRRFTTAASGHVSKRWRLPSAYQSGFRLAMREASSLSVGLLRFGLEGGEVVELSFEVGNVAPAA